MNLTITTPQGTTYNGNNVKSITLPTTSGIITVMDDHIPLFSVVSTGEIIIKENDNTEIFLAVSKGIIEIARDSNVKILADTAERADEIDVERAEEAKKQAEEFLKKQFDNESFDYANLYAKIEKEMARIQVAKKWKK